MEKTTWYGKDKFHYEVKKSRDILYRCTSVMKNQDDVLQTLIERYERENGVIHIFCNGEKIKTLNRLKIGRKKKYQWSNPS